MARNISVKIPTSVLIAQVESAIAEIDEAIANYPAALEKYKADSEAYKIEIAKVISDFLVKNADKVGYEYDSVVRVIQGYNDRVELHFDPVVAGFPKRPEKPVSPNQQTYFGREYTTKKQLLERNLKILRMTSQEEVSASTYGALMEIL